MQLKVIVEEVDELTSEMESATKTEIPVSGSGITEKNELLLDEDSHKKISVPNNDANISAGNEKYFSTVSNQHSEIEKSDWYIVGASAIGRSHAGSGKPCEDYHYCLNIENNWGVAVVSDGAGSAENSSLGSEFVSKRTTEFLKWEVLNRGWQIAGNFPGDKEWEQVATHVLKRVSTLLQSYATDKSLEFKSVSCTLIAIIFSPGGLLITHIGDGRAAYCNKQNEWKSIITPHKGQEANQTIFITDNSFFEVENPMISGVSVPECRVINESPTAFTLMTDGCERHSFFCSRFDIDINKWSDPNIPAEKFFNPLVENLKSLKINKVKLSEANEKWMKFLHDGMPGFKTEPDDKTMILGILI